jgi:GAF domain-containing protein
MNNLQPIPASGNLQLFPTPDYLAWRERFVRSVLRILSILGILLVIAVLPSASIGGRILLVGSYAILLTITILKTSYFLRAYTLLGLAFAMGLNSILARGPMVNGSLFLGAFVILSSLLFDSKLDFYALGFSLLTIVGLGILSQLGWFKPSLAEAQIPTLTDWLGVAATFGILGILLVSAINQYKQTVERTRGQIQAALTEIKTKTEKVEETVDTREKRVQLRAERLRSASIVARKTSELHTINELLDTMVNSIAEEFGFYHTGIYLYDEERKQVFLQAASSIAGKQLIGQKVRLDPETQNMIRMVIQRRKPYISSDPTGNVFVNDPDFPLTRSRLVLPLLVRGEAIGMLELHSDQLQGFNQEDADILQTLADLTAVSIENLRLFSETKTLTDQLDSYKTSQISDAWWKFTSRRVPSYQYTPAGVRPVFSRSKEEFDGDSLQVPLVLQGQKIGTLRLQKRGTEKEWSEKDRELVGKIADQAALALETSRLVDESQRSSQRDQVIANISSRVRQTLDIDSVVRVAASEFRRVFDLKEAEISVGAPSTEPAKPRKHTGTLRMR